jgi:hypothetical protein
MENKIIIIVNVINLMMAIVFLTLAIVDLIRQGNSYGYFFMIYLATLLITKLINK